MMKKAFERTRLEIVIQEADRLSIPVEPPNIYKSQAKTDYIKGYPYGAVLLWVENAAELIIKVRPFANLKDFVNRIDLRR